MKKVFAAIVALFMLTTVGFSKDLKTVKPKVETIQASIVSIDKTKSEIVVKDAKSSEEKTFVVTAKTLLLLKEGENVKIKFEEGTNIAKSVKILKNVKAPQTPVASETAAAPAETK
jgi:hypothetical protein